MPVSAVPVLLGGEHTVTLGALRAIKKHLIYTSGTVHIDPSCKSPAGDSGTIPIEPSGTIAVQSSVNTANAPFGIIQIDAHADLRDSYEGSRLSHACVMRRAVEDLGIPLFQIGVRAISHEEVIFRSENKIPYIDARDIYLKGIFPDSFLPAGFPLKIYITLDVDGLDPSVIRATGTPVPGGIGWHDTLTLLECVIKGREVVGFDVVELAPVKGDHASDFAAAQLAYSVMGMVKRLSRR
ncbi:MAG: arginase family protein [Desulfamplus sp.]|nr:arginase family protein [Desulfamplus sp.]